MRHAGDGVEDAEDQPFAEPHQHQAIHRALDGSDDLTADPLPIRAEGALAGDPQLLVQHPAFLEQEEQRQQGEHEQSQPGSARLSCHQPSTCACPNGKWCRASGSGMPFCAAPRIQSVALCASCAT